MNQPIRLIHSKQAQSSFFKMPCPYSCDACLQNEWMFDKDAVVCEGGYDMFEEFHDLCLTCWERKHPATQDYQRDEIDEFLKTLPPPEESVDMAAEVFTEMKMWMEHPVKVRLPVTKVRQVVTPDGQTLTFKYYKPFDKYLQAEEMEDFSNFLHLIF